MPLNTHLRKLWEQAGYSTKMGSAAVVPPPPSMWRRVYYLTSAEYAVSNIVFARIKLVRFTKLNDPFELLAPKSIDKSVQARVAEFRNTFDEENGVLCFS